MMTSVLFRVYLVWISMKILCLHLVVCCSKRLVSVGSRVFVFAPVSSVGAGSRALSGPLRFLPLSRLWSLP
jgi:hypothetical protein